MTPESVPVSSRANDAAHAGVVITVYPVTGKQLFLLRVPERFCRECDLTIHQVERAADALRARGVPVSVGVKPWLRYLFSALRHGGWHPPVVVINGRRFSQGKVPNVGALEAELSRAIGR